MKLTYNADEELVARRRLGQTNLAVKAGQVGTSNATKPENLGTFDYAHLRAPLPKGIVSGIFKPGAPASYFLMRRSQDGYISATGMFKATFPWAELAEEEAERKYIKGLGTTSTDETAGNVWIPPTHALQLAEEYQISTWIRALLDNQPIDINLGKDVTPKAISPPPRYTAPALLPRTTRSTRSASPSKITTLPPSTPGRKIASPRKAKTPRASTLGDSHSKAANNSLQETLKQAAEAEPEANSEAESADEKKADGANQTKADAVKSGSGEELKVRVNVDTDVEVNGDVETTHTHVEVEMPAGLPELPLPEDTEGMIAKAKEMVEAALKAEAASAKGVTRSSKSSKRKAEVIEEEEEGDEDEILETGPIVKRTKVESELKKEKVKKRALIGLSATLAVG